MIETEKTSNAALFNLAKTALSTGSSSGGTATATSATTTRVAAAPPVAEEEPRAEEEGASNGRAVPPPPGLLSRGSSLSRASTPQQREYEWRRFLTVEERQGVRSKIKQAYKNACKSYDDLLTTVVAIEEELLHISAPSRLDYFKSGCQFDKRVAEKRKQFTSAPDDDPAKRLKLDV